MIKANRSVAAYRYVEYFTSAHTTLITYEVWNNSRADRVCYKHPSLIHDKQLRRCALCYLLSCDINVDEDDRCGACRETAVHGP